MKLIKTVLIILFAASSMQPLLYANPTVISGAASCYMPPMIEIEPQTGQSAEISEQAKEITDNTSQSKNSLQPQKEEIAAKTQQTINEKTVISENNEKVVIYSVCAK